MRAVLTLLPLLLTIGSCSSPPQPPQVDEWRRRPANAGVAIELQTCKGDLQNTRIAARESALVADATKVTVARLRLQQRPPPKADPANYRNTVHSVLFAFGSTKVNLPDEQVTHLIDEARTAPLILLSGRTDGTAPSAAESRVARERADAVKAQLVRAGIDPAKIRATWQPVGDHAADNGTDSGRSLNRRVEIEIYRIAPRHASVEAHADRGD